MIALTATATAAFLAWLWLVFNRGWFWRTDVRLEPALPHEEHRHEWPPVSVIVPARDEADMLPSTLPLLLSQDYPGPGGRRKRR